MPKQSRGTSELAIYEAALGPTTRKSPPLAQLARGERLPSAPESGSRSLVYAGRMLVAWCRWPPTARAMQVADCDAINKPAISAAMPLARTQQRDFGGVFVWPGSAANPDGRQSVANPRRKARRVKRAYTPPIPWNAAPLVSAGSLCLTRGGFHTHPPLQQDSLQNCKGARTC
jgi:hypothetical protein